MISANNTSTVVLSHTTALRGLRHARTNQGIIPWNRLSQNEQRYVMQRATGTKSKIDVGALVRQGFWEQDKPFDIVVGHQTARGTSPQFKCRVYSTPLPEYSLLHVDAGIYCCSPELVTQQLIELGYDEVKIAVLISEFCGGFSMSKTDRLHPDLEGDLTVSQAPVHGYREAEAATSIKGIESILRPLGSGKTARILKKALQISVEGSRSPMEAIAGMMFHTPAQYGGFGIRQLMMNYRIDFNHEGQRASNLPYAVCDIYIPAAHVTLEYNGSVHDDHYQRIHDERRTAGLQAMGITTIPLNDYQLRNIEALDAIARTIYRLAGKRFQIRVKGYAVKQINLLNALRTGYHLASC